MLRDTVREVLQRECAPEVVRAAWEGRPEGVRAVWDTLAETGVIGMTASEDAGGMAMSELDLVLPLEEMGYAALPGPIVDTVAVGIPLLEAAGTDAQKERWLGPAAAGEARIVVSFEDQALVPHAASADVLIIQRGGVAYCCLLSVVNAPRWARLPSSSGSRAACWTWRSSTRKTGNSSASRSARSKRSSTGSPTRSSSKSSRGPARDAEIDVSLAKIYAGQAAKFVAKEALQVHGAIGYTIECDLHMWMKRAWALAAAHGDAAYHRERVGRHIL
ncbi:MAG: acyl-CoA dehydrogenase family protein [Deltaproteobacteria bacterium]|nr:acyl-CoA dehydrogenase family protein [Deltaproteobacteria bacterium]